MKILISSISIKDYPSGIFYRSLNLAKALVDSGNDVTLLTTQNASLTFPYSQEFRDGVKIVSFPSIMPTKIKKLGYALLPVILKFFYLKNKSFDVCHCDNHRPASFIPLWLYSRKRDNLVVEWMDYFGKGGIYDNKSWKWKMTVGAIDNYLEKKAIIAANGVVVLSDFLMEKAKSLGQRKNCIEKVWGGSDIDNINYYKTSGDLREKYSIPKSVIVFCVANMSNFEFKKYSRELKFILESVPNSIIIRTGEKSDSIPEFIKGRIKEYDKLTYSSYCELLSASDAFILIQENSVRQISRWPNIIGDFLAAGRPIIIKPVGESANCASKYPDAFILLNNDKRELSLEEEVVKKNNDANKRKIRRIAETEFSWKERAKQLSDFYANLFDNNCVK